MNSHDEPNMECCTNGVDIKPFSYALSLISGKWKLTIMFWLRQKKVMRYGELKRSLGNITHKMLSNQLKELEADGLIHREEYPQIPPKVEYSITELGYSLMPIMSTLCKWGHEHIPEGWEPK